MATATTSATDTQQVPTEPLQITRYFLNSDQVVLRSHIGTVYGSAHSNPLVVGLFKLIEEIFGVQLLKTMHFNEAGKIVTIHFGSDTVKKIKEKFGENFFKQVTIEKDGVVDLEYQRKHLSLIREYSVGSNTAPEQTPLLQQQ